MIDMALPVSSDDGTLTESNFLHKMSVMTVEAAKNLGRPIHLAPHYKEMLEAAGFEDVHFKKFKWPSNIWPKDPKFKEMGRWNFANIDPGLEGLTLFLFTHGLGMSKEETLAYCAGARKEIRDVKIHAYWPLYVLFRIVSNVCEKIVANQKKIGLCATAKSPRAQQARQRDGVETMLGISEPKRT